MKIYHISLSQKPACYVDRCVGCCMLILALLGAMGLVYAF